LRLLLLLLVLFLPLLEPPPSAPPLVVGMASTASSIFTYRWREKESQGETVRCGERE